MKPTEIIEIIENIAPLSYAASWDHSGVQVGSFQKKITHIGVMLDPCLCSIEKAISQGADFLIAHHPLSMVPRYPNLQDKYLAILSLLLRNDICLYSAHTSLDASPKGTAHWLADAFGIVSHRFLEPLGEEHGFGFYGALQQSLSYEQFIEQVKKVLGISVWRACGPQPEVVRTVACCPGSGASLLSNAKACGADVFITGDIKYHTALESSVRILDVGHFILEEEMMRLFATKLSEEVALSVSFIASNDPLSFEGI